MAGNTQLQRLGAKITVVAEITMADGCGGKGEGQVGTKDVRGPVEGVKKPAVAGFLTIDQQLCQPAEVHRLWRVVLALALHRGLLLRLPY